MEIVDLFCQECGNPFERAAKEHNRNQKFGRTTYCSLRCNAIGRNKKYSKGNVNNFGGKKRQKDEWSAFRYFIRKAKARDSEKGIHSNIDLEFLKELWEKQLGRCAYSNIQMDLNIFPRQPHSASLDRIDSSKGYQKDNVEFVCLAVNFGKNIFSKKQMHDFISKVKG
jgi:hypothetical protein